MHCESLDELMTGLWPGEVLLSKELKCLWLRPQGRESGMKQIGDITSTMQNTLNPHTISAYRIKN
jgi:hypothetical protein